MQAQDQHNHESKAWKYLKYTLWTILILSLLAAAVAFAIGTWGVAPAAAFIVKLALFANPLNSYQLMVLLLNTVVPAALISSAVSGALLAVTSFFRWAKRKFAARREVELVDEELQEIPVEEARDDIEPQPDQVHQQELDFKAEVKRLGQMGGIFDDERQVGERRVPQPGGQLPADEQQLQLVIRPEEQLLGGLQQGEVPAKEVVEALETLKLPEGFLSNLDLNILKRLHREIILQCHPDRPGGDLDRYIRMMGALDVVNDFVRRGSQNNQGSPLAVTSQPEPFLTPEILLRSRVKTKRRTKEVVAELSDEEVLDENGEIMRNLFEQPPVEQLSVVQPQTQPQPESEPKPKTEHPEDDDRLGPSIQPTEGSQGSVEIPMGPSRKTKGVLWQPHSMMDIIGAIGTGGQDTRRREQRDPYYFPVGYGVEYAHSLLNPRSKPKPGPGPGSKPIISKSKQLIRDQDFDFRVFPAGLGLTTSRSKRQGYSTDDWIYGPERQWKMRVERMPNIHNFTGSALGFVASSITKGLLGGVSRLRLGLPGY